MLRVLGTLLLATSGLACGGKPDPRPDVILVIVDTWRADHLSLYGHPRKTSPALDDWAAGAAVFEDAQAHSGWTLASIGSLLTGLYPTEHGAIQDPGRLRRFGFLGQDKTTLAELFQSAGWRTGAFVNNTFLAPEFRLNQGFEHYSYQGAGRLDHRSAADTVQAAIAWLASDSEPAFLLLHLMEPHLEYNPPEATSYAFRSRDTDPPLAVPFESREVMVAYIEEREIPTPAQQEWIRLAYDEELLGVDLALAGFRDKLQALERGEPWQVITSDHGEEFWDHGGFEHGHSLNRELVRVPLVVKGPGVRSARYAETVSHVDVFATLAGISGQVPPVDSHGVDLRTALTGTEPMPRGRAVLQENCHYGQECAAVVKDKQRLVLRLETLNASLWHLDAQGLEQPWDDPKARDTTGRTLYGILMGMRGGLEVRAVGDWAIELDDEDFERLKTLGYVE